MLDDAFSTGPPVLGTAEVKGRARSGAAILLVRGASIRGIGALTTLVVARLLTPADFGAIAAGLTIVSFVGLLSDGGLGAALIRGDHSPSRLMFEQLLGLQFAIACVATVVVLAAGPLFGRPGWIAAILTGSLCVAVFQTSGNIYLERNLLFRKLALVEVAQNVAYAVWAVVTVMLGAGVWGLVTANVVQVLTATVLVIAVSPARVLRPRWGVDAIRPLLSFGVRFQAIGVVNLVRDQGLNLGIVAVSGLSTLGLWSMAYRFLQIPFLLFETLWRITFPAMARLIEAGEDPRPIVERILARAAVLTGATLSVLVGVTPALISVVLNSRWHPIISILPWGCAGLLVGGPVSVAVAGFLFAQGDAGTVLRAAIVHTVAFLAIALGLLPVIGVAAVGIGLMVSASVDGLILGWRAGEVHDVHFGRALVVPTVVSALAGGSGWVLASVLEPRWIGLVAGLAASASVFLVAMCCLDRAGLKDALDVILSAGRRARA